ncbi:hypothetical protein C8F01DRAFT_1370896, partial [Mycena amicta]
MSQGNKPLHWSSFLLVDYNDTRIPLGRRLTALGLESGTLAMVGFTIGAVCGAIPRAVEAVGEFSSATQPHSPTASNRPRCARQRSFLRNRWQCHRPRDLPAQRSALVASQACCRPARWGSPL